MLRIKEGKHNTHIQQEKSKILTYKLIKASLCRGSVLHWVSYVQLQLIIIYYAQKQDTLRRQNIALYIILTQQQLGTIQT